jgi:hypothetical protein
MSLDPTNFLRCIDDSFTQVRDMETGRLLGCVPRVQDGAPAIADTNGVAFELRIGAIVAVVCDLNTQKPTSLPGFIPLDGADLSPNRPTASSAADDLARAV